MLGSFAISLLTGEFPMLAEKFFLLLETLRSNVYDDGAPRIVSTSRFVAIALSALRAS
jgi:hypothetical protein